MFEPFHFARQVVIIEHLFDFFLCKSPVFIGDNTRDGNHPRVIHTCKNRFLCHAHATRNDAKCQTVVRLKSGRNKTTDEGDDVVENRTVGILHIVNDCFLQWHVVFIEENDGLSLCHLI